MGEKKRRPKIRKETKVGETERGGRLAPPRRGPGKGGGGRVTSFPGDRFLSFGMACKEHPSKPRWPKEQVGLLFAVAVVVVDAVVVVVFVIVVMSFVSDVVDVVRRCRMLLMS